MTCPLCFRLRSALAQFALIGLLSLLITNPALAQGQAGQAANSWMMAKYDELNPAALRKLMPERAHHRSK